MADGLFTPAGFQSPEEIRRQIGQAQLQEDVTLSQLTPQQTTMLLARQAGRGVGQAVGGLFGLQPQEDPRVTQARKTQEVLQGVDFSDPQSVIDASRTAIGAGFPSLAAGLISQAKESAALQATLQPEDGKAFEEGQFTEVKSGDSIVSLRFQEGAPDVGFGPGQVPITTAKRFAPPAQTTVQNFLGGNEFAKAFGKNMGKQLAEGHEKASIAAQSLAAAKETIKLLDAGVITGTAANIRLGIGRFLHTVGLYDGDEVSNSEAFLAAQAKQVADIITAFGAGTGLSDKDREFAEKAAGARIDMTEEAIRKILKLNEKASKFVINRFNNRIKDFEGKVEFPFDPTIEVPTFNLPEAPQAKAGAFVRGPDGVWRRQ